MTKQFLYIIQNELMPAYCKIGISNDVNKRVGTLYGEWRIHAIFTPKNPAYYELKVKNKLNDFKVSGHEMFNCPVSFLTKVTEAELDSIEEVSLPKGSSTIDFSTRQLGKLIKKTRKLQKLTQAQLAAASGTGVRFIIEIEKGKPTAEISKVILICNMLGLRLYVAN